MRIDKICAVFLAIGLIFGGVISSQRAEVESDYKNYEIVMDYQELVKVSAAAKADIYDYGIGMKDAGIHAVAITEETIDSLSLNPNYGIRYYLSGYDLVVEGEQEILEFIKTGLEETLKIEREIVVEDGKIIIEGSIEDHLSNTTKVTDYLGSSSQAVNIFSGSKLAYIGLGYSLEKIELIQSMGLEVNLRPVYFSEYQDAVRSVNRLFDTIDQFGINQSYIISSGGEVIGNDEDGYLASRMISRNMLLVPIEDTTQRQHIATIGQDKLIKDLDYNAVRGFTTWNYIQRRYDYEIPLHHNGEEIVNSFYRAISERNVRLIYFKPYITPSEKYVTELSVYERTLGQLESRLAEHNIKPGTISAMAKYEPNALMRIPVIIATLAAGFMILDNLVRIKKKYLEISFAVLSLGASGLYWSGIARDTVEKGFGLLASILLPGLAICFVLAAVKKIEEKGIKKKSYEAFFMGMLILAITIGISLVGAVLEVSMLSHSKYLLEMDIFKGVKISQLAPMGIAVLLYIAFFGYRREKENYAVGIRLKELTSGLNETIKIWQVLLCGVLLVVVYIFIARSGNDSGLSVSSIELLFRNILEIVLPVRPRTKSMFLGFPAVIMMVYLAYINRYRIVTPILILMVAIGQSNITNTFSHLRTPLYISFQRVGYEYLISIIVAVIAILGIMLIIKIESEVKKKLKGK